MCTELIVIAMQMIQFCVTVDLLHGALHKLQSAYLAASVHSSQTCTECRQNQVAFVFLLPEKACGHCYSSCMNASAQCHHILDCLFWDVEMCNQIKTTYTTSLCFVFQRWVAHSVH